MIRAWLATLFCLFASLAYAGDAARFAPLGFTADGGIFAFEQYGIQDGSGFAYAERFYINTADERFLPNTPIRKRLDNETMDTAQARAEAKQAALVATGLQDTMFSMDNANIVASRAISQLDAGHSMQFLPRPIFPPIDAPLMLKLNEKALQSSALCAELSANKGFELLLGTLIAGGTFSTLNDDESVPASRNCPTGYALHQAITFYPEGAAPILVVIIAIRSYGFEGPDHRFMAITHQLNG